ncbi:PhzF family phenazine biosynthesis protein [Pelagovum pacificum]|uniref:PhzF family phenazine biosynthesis protein n=1 Tax=Pelagovum pacificum TaxID=2588711 RepID=A0A5C5GEQ3_9RHOB|nr:PhzF family phenazine biosynthesis protein [Pelagovum pacificum]QQA44808.1 PhzF family phenazine biosynthesis protein [Pelagovum pacificum]TNY32086.1 PhzF family phenazine biosynthesis protein [Pelagovum pacificum]
MTRYLTYDVFTAEAFGGNPLAVVLEAEGLSTEAMQRIAREFNYSETTFVLPAEDPSHTAKVRIFTPTMEVPFAGHPTIGTAIALADDGHAGDMVFELGIGPIPVTVSDGHAVFETRVPLRVIAHPTPDEIAACLGLPVDRIAGQPVMGGVGLDFVMVALTDRAALAAIDTDIAAFRRGAAAYPGALDFALAAYVRSGGTVDVRMFAPLDNIPEDPATGSAAAALGALFGPGDYEMRQGEDMGRPSAITVSVADDGAIRVGGRAVRIMEGTLLRT